MSSPDRILSRRTYGVTLVELIIFIVIVSASVVGVLSVMNVSTKRSADPMLRKQALDIADSLLEEVFLQPFTFCDPDDPNLTVATSATPAQCPTEVEAMGPENGESRYASLKPFDNVNDYNGFSMNGITDLTNTPITALSGYTATVAIVDVGANYTAHDVTAGDALQITVTVTNGNVSIPVSAIRFRRSPNYAP